jgi:hypothetical protein
VNDETELRLTDKVLALRRDHPEDYAAIVGMIREGDGVDPEDQDCLVDFIRESRVRRAGKARENSSLEHPMLADELGGEELAELELRLEDLSMLAPTEKLPNEPGVDEALAQVLADFPGHHHVTSLRSGLTHDDVAVFRRHCEVLEELNRRQQAD